MRLHRRFTTFARSKLAGLFLALALTTGAALASQPSAALAAGACRTSPSQANCDFKNPAIEGCKTDKALKFRRKIWGTSGVLYVYKVFYSNACNSVWASVTKKAFNGNRDVGILRNATFPLDAPNMVLCTAPAPTTCDTGMFFAIGDSFSIYANDPLDPSLSFPGVSVSIFAPTLPPEPGD